MNMDHGSTISCTFSSRKPKGDKKYKDTKEMHCIDDSETRKNPILDLSETDLCSQDHQQISEIERRLQVAKDSFSVHLEDTPCAHPTPPLRTPKTELSLMKAKIDQIQNELIQSSDPNIKKSNLLLLERLRTLKDNFDQVLALYNSTSSSQNPPPPSSAQPSHPENLSFNYNIKVENNTKIYTIGHYSSDSQDQSPPRLQIHIDDLGECRSPRCHSKNTKSIRFLKENELKSKSTMRRKRSERNKSQKHSSGISKKAGKMRSNKLCQYYQMVDLSTSNERQQTPQNKKLNSRLLSKNSYLANLQLKYKGKNNPTNKAIAKIRKSRKAVSKSGIKKVNYEGDYATRRFNYKKSKLAEGSNSRNTKNSPKLNKCRVSPSTKRSKNKSKGGKFKVPSLHLSNRIARVKNVSSTCKNSSSINRAFNNKRSPIRNLKYVSEKTSSTKKSETFTLPKEARSDLKKYMSPIMSNRSVKRINVDLEVVPPLLTFECENNNPLDAFHDLNTSQSSTTEFNALSSPSEISQKLQREEISTDDPLHNIKKKLSKRIDILFA
ncbi:unnamed protein product [Moneuplotes crassus]|uniref:Uncharacterized protein n=1 Tax=Euplotes crassus TaxID=5936 RepID=A0AAD1Y0T3_EUPCR|nr:unnamed protein product [Moneuplotes crassus]